MTCNRLQQMCTWFCDCLFPKPETGCLACSVHSSDDPSDAWLNVSLFTGFLFLAFYAPVDTTSAGILLGVCVLSAVSPSMRMKMHTYLVFSASAFCLFMKTLATSPGLDALSGARGWSVLAFLVASSVMLIATIVFAAGCGNYCCCCCLDRHPAHQVINFFGGLIPSSH